MPSSGEFPFLQGFFCGFNNTCFKTEQEAQYDTSKINHTMYVRKSIFLISILFITKKFNNNCRSQKEIRNPKVISSLLFIWISLHHFWIKVQFGGDVSGKFIFFPEQC